VNTAHARQRGPGERANAEIKNWKILRKIRSSRSRATNPRQGRPDTDPRGLTSGWKGLNDRMINESQSNDSQDTP
jgi:hypothetical protein